MNSFILNIPTELQEKVFLYMSYDEIARLRLVCRTFNKVCQCLLNKGFVSVERFHGSCLRNVKAQLPRRESERRNHSLARHCDILNSIETRLSLLSMTFIKYVELNLCCFIPGKVIDEIYRVLRIIRLTRCAPRAHEILQELRDISSMAMEHFDEFIVPTLKQKMIVSSVAHLSLSPSAIEGAMNIARNPRYMPLPRTLRNEFTKVQQACKLNSIAIRRDLSDVKIKGQGFEKRFTEISHLITDQNVKIAEQEGRINEMNRKLVEYDRRFAELCCGASGESRPTIPMMAATVAAISSTSSVATAATSAVVTLPRSARVKASSSRSNKNLTVADDLMLLAASSPAACTRSKRRLFDQETQSPKRK